MKFEINLSNGKTCMIEICDELCEALGPEWANEELDRLIANLDTSDENESS